MSSQTLDFLLQKYGLDPSARLPIEIPNVGRDDLARLFGELGFTRGAEIGTEQGVYAEVICRANPGVALFCIDAWQAYKGYRDHVSQSKLDGFFEATQKRLAPFAVEFIRGFSMDAVKKFADKSLDFVYLDANHELPFIMFDLIEWSKKVRPGGIVAGHDYYQSTRFDTKNHVVYAVEAYTRSYRIKPWFLLGTKEKKRRGDPRPLPFLVLGAAMTLNNNPISSQQIPNRDNQVNGIIFVFGQANLKARIAQLNNAAWIVPFKFCDLVTLDNLAQSVWKTESYIKRVFLGRRKCLCSHGEIIA